MGTGGNAEKFARDDLKSEKVVLTDQPTALTANQHKESLKLRSKIKLTTSET